MQPLGLNEIRERYLSFFESKGHLRMPSFSLVPKNDPSILLINAGMTPLKPYFTGAETPPCRRVTTCQKCIRTPDIENVGHTARHGTYFEMLGNFSFGDYFKEEVIPWAWEFLTKDLEMDPELLYPSVYVEDDEAFEIWNKKIGIPAERITRLGKEDNFWEHGTGPCGPCSEIYYDRGVEKGCGKPDCKPGCECDRFVEIWNLVFSQFDRQEDGSYLPLAQKNIDTGGGLERFACVMQGVDNLFEVDTVRKILDTVCEKANKKYGENQKDDVAIRVITDHMRSSTMMISDGVLPSNAGAGYVLRRLMRRAARFGKLLGIEGKFLADIAEVVIDQNKDAYPELVSKYTMIMTVINKEEDDFLRTVEAGTKILNDMIEDAKSSGKNVLSGDDAFKLHDTYGFPLDLTKEIARDAGLTVDEEGFKAAMKEQKERARKATKENVSNTAWGGNRLPDELLEDTSSTEFLGYDSLETPAEIKYLLKADDEGTLHIVDEVFEGDKAVIILDKTTMYATMGGQVNDEGQIANDDMAAEVISVDKDNAGKYLHTAEITKGTIRKGDKVTVRVDKAKRMATCRNHTSTHILQAALREVLGDHVQQKGSYVDSERLRFDFTHFNAMTKEEISKVEEIVNEKILEDLEVTTRVMKQNEARELGAMAFFDDKYGEEVRVVTIGDIDDPFSIEFCGGTHMKHSSQAGQFRIVSEQGIASGIRRIEAVTGKACYEQNREDRGRIEELAGTLKVNKDQLVKKSENLIAEVKSLEKEIAQIQKAAAGNAADDLIKNASEIGGVTAVIAKTDAQDAASLRDMADSIKDRLESGFVFLASDAGDKVLFVSMATKDAVSKGAHAGNVIKEAARIAGGGGGGRPDMAQAGGKDKSKIDEALSKAKEIVTAQLGG
ncbi:MAG TPA: alanine--tRNA ligase [Clostridiales bacterium]|nr:alanine--tRNA ligase [Clostridiales bacterium]